VRGEPFVEVNWASGLDERGRPIETPQGPDKVTYPGVQGGTNWYSPSYSPSTELFYLSAWENYGSVFKPEETEYIAGVRFVGGVPASPIPGIANLPGIRRGPINNCTEALGNGAVIAIDPRTGAQRWRFPTTDVSSSGISDDRERSLVHRQPRRLLLCARRTHRHAALAHELGRSRCERSDVLCPRWRAIRRGRRGQRLVRIRPARLIRFERRWPPGATSLSSEMCSARV
jgi:hypothetical protein